MWDPDRFAWLFRLPLIFSLANIGLAEAKKNEKVADLISSVVDRRGPLVFLEKAYCFKKRLAWLEPLDKFLPLGADFGVFKKMIP